MTDDAAGGIDVSDEASGLPPLDQIDPARVLSAFAVDVSQEGVLALYDVDAAGERRLSESQPAVVVYLSVRGWTVAPEDSGVSAWSQIHIAIPAEFLGTVVALLASRMAAGA